MTGLAAVVGVVIMDAAMVNLGARAIRADLGLTQAELSRVVDAYLIAFGGLLLLGGRLADVLGGRKVFLAGLAVYVAASAGCALSASGTTLTVARIVQGAGAAVLSPAALSLLLGLYPVVEDRRRVLGIWGGVAGAGSLLGVFLGGVVTQELGWQAIFWLPVPVGIGVAALVWCALPASPSRSDGRFDLPGAATITLGASALALGLISAPEVGWGSPRTLASLAVGVAALGAFAVVERRSDQPLVPPEVFRRGPVVTANSAMLLLGAAAVGLFFFLPQYQQHILGMSPVTTGLSQLPIAVMITLGGFTAPWLARLLGARMAMVSATVALTAGMFWLALGNADAGYAAALLGPFLLIGLGLGLGLVYATTIAVSGATPAETGLLSGLSNAARQLGGALGLAALAAAATVGSGTGGGGVDFQTAFLGLSVIALLTVVLSMLPALHRQPARTEEPCPPTRAGANS